VGGAGATQALAEDPVGCLGVISDRYMAMGTRFRVVDLWIQALNEASDDAVIAKARCESSAAASRRSP